MRKLFSRLEEVLGRRVGDRGFPIALTCALVAILTPTLALIKTGLGGHVQHLGWLVLTPIFALLAKLFAGIDWIVTHQARRVLLIGVLVIAASAEILYLGHLLGVHLGV
ncbi:hypothetical protein EON81_00985 [bacterium]|nr:MAG: hypothetical protein EON81_00985 [bacterium]